MMKLLLLLGLALLLYLGLLQLPPALAKAGCAAARQLFPGSECSIDFSAPPFWFLTGDVHAVSISLSHFDTSRLSVRRASQPAPGASPSGDETTEPPGPLGVEGGTGSGPGPRPPGQTSAGSISGNVRWAEVGRVELNLVDFTVYGKHLQSLRVDLPHIRYDFWGAVSRRRIRFGSSGQGAVQIVLSADDLTQSLPLDRTDIRSLVVHCDPGRLRITLEFRTPLGWAPVSVAGELSVQDGHAIYFTNPVISAANLTLPQMVTDLIINRVQKLNPVFDLDQLKLPVDLELTSVTAAPPGLIIQGEISLRPDSKER